MQQQLSLFEEAPPAGAVPVWETLDEQQREQIVRTLARVIAKFVADMEVHDE